MALCCRIGGAKSFRSVTTLARCLHVAHRMVPEGRWTGRLEELSGAPPTTGNPFARSAPSRFFAAPASIKKAKEKAMEKESGPRTNEEIDAEYVRLVTDEGHGVVTRKEALDRARKLELDLVEVSREADPPVCKIMDFHKEKFRKQAKIKELAKTKADTSVRKGDCKEVKFTGKIEKKDLELKAETVKRLMERGYRVKVVAEAGKQSGSSDADKEDLGKVLSRLYKLIEDDSALESPPLVKERMAYLIVRHVKFGTKKNPPKKTSKEDEAEGIIAQANAKPVSSARSIVTSEQSLRVAETSASGSQTEITRPNSNIHSSPAMDRLRSKLSHTGKDNTSGITKARLDSTIEHRDNRTPPPPSYTSPEPPPDLSNRYKKSVPTKHQAIRTPSRHSFVEIRDDGNLDHMKRNSVPGSGNRAGRVSFQPLTDRRRNRDEQFPNGPSRFQSNFRTIRTPERSRPNPGNANQNAEKSTSDKGNDPRPKIETNQEDWGIFSR